MCYSATASFISSAVIGAIGLMSTFKAYRINRSYLLLALVPLFFAIQQASEGWVWLDLAAHSVVEASSSVYFYLFFAFFFWPVYMPLAVSVAETNAARSHFIFKLVYLGFLLGLGMYGPLVTGLVKVHATVSFHSVLYETYELPWLAYTYGVFYAITGIFPFLLATRLAFKVVGMIILGSMILSHLYFYYAFTSIWCYFVAIISLAIWVVIEPAKREV